MEKRFYQMVETDRSDGIPDGVIWKDNQRKDQTRSSERFRGIASAVKAFEYCKRTKQACSAIILLNQ